MNLRVKDLHFSYNGTYALSGIDLDMEGGSLIGLVGPNGSGKSTLLKNLDRILQPGKGKVLIDSRDLSSMKRRETARRIGYVPQSSMNLFPKTVFETVLMGRIPHGSWAPTRKDLDLVSGILKEFDLEALSSRDLNSLSGGQRQKVIIARAVAQEPDMLLLDEPTSSLDLANQIDVMELIKKQTGKGILAIMAVHDLNLALRYCDRFVLLKAGKVVAKGDSEALSRKVLEDVYEIKAKVLGEGRDKVFIPLSRRVK